MKRFTPERLLNKARRINWLLHPSRNNPRHRYVLYHGFISWVGTENWERVRPEIKNCWESASNSFDKLLGLLKVYRLYTSPDELLVPVTEKKEDISEGLNKCIEIMSILNGYNQTKPSAIEHKCLKALLCSLVADDTCAKTEIIAYLEDLIGECE